MVKDDPRDLSTMTYSDNQFRHKVVFYGTAPSFWGISVGLRFSGIGGTRYSLAVSGNMNGDFVSSTTWLISMTRTIVIRLNIFVRVSKRSWTIRKRRRA